VNGRGRPLRFVVLVAASWTSARVLILWPEGATLPEAIEQALPIQRFSARAGTLPVAAPVAARPLPLRATAVPQVTRSDGAPAAVERARVDPVALDRLASVSGQVLGAPLGALPASPQVATLPLSAQPLSRWSASGWFVTRRGAPAGGAMLGGDQVGLRVAYAFGAAQRTRFYLRATAPLAMPGREVAAGVEWQPTDLPLRIVGEQRFGLDGNRGGPSIAVIGGVDAVELPLKFELEAYGQAGAVWRGRADSFADGAARITREVVSAGGTRLALGAGVWGAAQRDAARLDMGPSAVVTLLLGEQAMKLSIDWRERVAGDARPGSGPAVTLGADF
jgi:hypothetical protein